MAVLPESMDKLNLDNPSEGLATVQEYIRYMGERIEFSFRNMTKTVSAAGVSSAELYILIQAQAQTLAAVQSTLNGLSGNITSMQHDITTIQETLTSLDQRVTALENAGTQTT